MPINRLQLEFRAVIRHSSGVLITALAPVRTSDVVIQPFVSGINLIKWRACVNTGKNQFSEIIDVRLRQKRGQARLGNILAKYVVS
jgi:hypothetical protein